MSRESRLLAGAVGIDAYLGPSEIVVLADETGDPAFIAADLLAQAEHDPGSCFLLTTSAELAGRVQREIERQLAERQRGEAIQRSLADLSAIIVGPMPALLELANRFGAEHVNLQVRDESAALLALRHAGAVFIGGHSPVVVFGDADPEKAADTIAAFKYRNAGQVCISPTRFYVQEDVYKKFLARFTEYAKNLKVGDGLEKGIAMGPLANSRRLDAMDSFVADAKDRGGKVQTGGARRGNQGYFYEPTVITDVPDDSKIMTQEPFGPLAPVVTFKSFDEVV